MNKKTFYVIIVILIVFMLIHIEISLMQKSAPENILIQVKDADDFPELNAECFAAIISGQINGKDKPLIKLNSVYDVIDPETYNINEVKGFYNLETGFNNY